MSYRCAFCKVVVPAGQRCNKVVTEWRTKHYPFRPKVHPGFTIKGGQLKQSSKSSDRVDDPGGVGKEIVSESYACEECAKKYNPSKD